MAHMQLCVSLSLSLGPGNKTPREKSDYPEAHIVERPGGKTTLSGGA